MSKRCVTARYKDREKALMAKRSVLRNLKLQSTIAYCDSCDMYHLRAEFRNDVLHPRQKLHAKWLPVLQCVAQGHRDHETGQFVKLKRDQVLYIINELMEQFNALSRPNLVAITIALGIIDPNNFVPQKGSHAA